jgi:hypothetical protein
MDRNSDDGPAVAPPFIRVGRRLSHGFPRGYRVDCSTAKRHITCAGWALSAGDLLNIARDGAQANYFAVLPSLSSARAIVENFGAGEPVQPMVAPGGPARPWRARWISR